MLSIAEKITCLKETELFRNMPVDALREIAEVAQELHLADGEVIFKDGEKGDSVYYVVDGEVRVDKDEVELVRIPKNRCVGEWGVIDEGPRSGTVSSVGDTVLLRVSRDDFYHVAQGNTELLQNVISILLRKLRRDTDLQIEAARAQERMKQDLVRAHEMQMNMLPEKDLRVEVDGGLCLRASGNCFPAEMVGGDYFDYFPLPDHQVGLVIGDVMGHGFHTGLMVSMAKSCLHTRIKIDYSVPSVIAAMNDMVCGFIHSDLFMGFCYMIVDLGDQTVSFCNAGHAYPYHYRMAAKQFNMLESNACPLGVLEHQCFETSQLGWDRDDVFALYTDGIVEALNSSGEEFGTERLERLIKENAQLPATQLKETILRAYKSFCRGVVQTDDVSLVIAKMGDSQPSPES